ncbi:phage tail tape measure protein [Chromatium okenii]|uniref:phage tail tape measure protein n=1 Tax=Chromatium okenii TaxID=61644 RepID=UPI0026EFD8E4|nr:phage tail tape measure protein [Chromatium okenii]MBV5310822.1 phage tail tape measure protein [Chromatium okenii]
MTNTANLIANIIIGADDQASSALQAIDGSVAALSKTLLAVGAIAGAFAVAMDAVKEAINFADSLAEVQKQLGDSGISMEQVREDVEELANTFGINANAVAQSAAGFLAAGNDYQNSAGLVRTANSLMVAGGLDATTATDAITQSLAGFRIPSEQAATSAEHIGDVLNKIGDISSGKFTEIIQGFSRISPVAKDAGFSMEETAAAVAVLVDIFGSGEIAATALKTGFLALVKPSTDAENALNALGVSILDGNKNLRSSKDILTDLSTRWGALTASQRLQTAATIFGTDQAGAMSVVLGDWAKLQGYVSQMLDQTTGAVGSMAREVGVKMALVSTQLDQTSEAWRQLSEHLGARILSDGAFAGLIGSARDLGTALKGAVDAGALDPIIATIQTAFSGVAAILSGTADAVNLLAAAFSNLDPIVAAGLAMAGTAAALTVLGSTLTAVTGYLASLSIGLTLVAVAGLQTFIAQLAAARAALMALMVAAAANPLMALASVLAVATAGFIAFRAASEETLASLTKQRSELGEQITKLQALQQTLQTAATDSAAFKTAQQELATLVPGLTLALDDQGMLVAKVGGEYAANAQRLADYIAQIKQADQTALVNQLALAYDAWQANQSAVQAHTQSLRENYGFGQEAPGIFQTAALALGQHTGEITRANATTVELNSALSTSSQNFLKLAVEAAQSGQSIAQISAALRNVGASDATIAGVVSQLQNLKSVAVQTEQAVANPWQAVALAARNAGEQMKVSLDAVSKEIDGLNKRIEAHRNTLTTALNAESAGWQSIGDLAKNAYGNQIAAINTATQARAQAISANLNNERAAAAASAALIQQETNNKIAAISQYQTQATALIDIEADHRLAAARASGANERSIDIERLTAKRSVLQSIEADYRSHIDKLNAEAQRHLSEVTRIEDQIKALKLSTEDRIREIQRGAMSDYAAYQDRQAQISETASAARRALAAGDFQQAQELAKKMQDLAAQQAQEVKDGEQVYVSKQQAASNATQGILAGAALEKQALEGLKQSHEQQAQSAQNAAQQTTAAMEKLGGQIKSLTDKLALEIKIKISVDQGNVKAEVDALDAVIKDKEFLVTAKADLTAVKEDLLKADELIKQNPLQFSARVDEATAVLERLKGYIAKLGDDAPIELKTSTNTLEQNLAAVKDKLKEMGAPTASVHTITTNVPEVNKELSTLNSTTTVSHHEIVGDATKTRELIAAEEELALATKDYEDAVASARAGDQSAAVSVAALGNAMLEARAKVAELAQAKAVDAQATQANQQSTDAAVGSLVTYGEWVRKSGEDAQAEYQQRITLAAAVGEYTDKVHALSEAYSAAKGVGADGVLPDPNKIAEAKSALEDAQKQVKYLQDELSKVAPPIEVKTNTDSIDEAKIKIETIDGVKTFSDHTITANVDAVAAQIAQLERDTSSTHTVYVHTVETNASGGQVGRFASGGAVFPRSNWDVVPGVGNSDSVRAALPAGSFVLKKAASLHYGSLLQRLATGGLVNTLLTPGERVFRPATVNRLGAGFFHALNNLHIPREALEQRLANLTAPVVRFADGGAVLRAPALAGAAPVSDTVNINLQIGRRSVTVQGAREQAQSLATALRELQRGL